MLPLHCAYKCRGVCADCTYINGTVMLYIKTNFLERKQTLFTVVLVFLKITSFLVSYSYLQNCPAQNRKHTINLVRHTISTLQWFRNIGCGWSTWYVRITESKYRDRREPPSGREPAEPIRACQVCGWKPRTAMLSRGKLVACTMLKLFHIYSFIISFRMKTDSK